MDRIKNIFITATIGFLVVTLLNSCHKYPDDSFLSLRRPEKRILGSYYLSNYFINGVDSANSPNYSYLLNQKSISLSKHDNVLYITNSTYNSFSSGWGYQAIFLNNEKSLSIIYIGFGPAFGVNIFVANDTTWKILKLYDKQLWLSSTINGKVYEIHLKQ